MTPNKRALIFLGLKTIQMALALSYLEIVFGYAKAPWWVSAILLISAVTILVAAIFVNPNIRRK